MWVHAHVLLHATIWLHSTSVFTLLYLCLYSASVLIPILQPVLQYLFTPWCSGIIQVITMVIMYSIILIFHNTTDTLIPSQNKTKQEGSHTYIHCYTFQLLRRRSCPLSSTCNCVFCYLFHQWLMTVLTNWTDHFHLRPSHNLWESGGCHWWLASIP